MSKLEYDIAIIGSGLSGMLLAAGLAALGLNIAIVDASSPRSNSNPLFSAPPDKELRALAIAKASQNILKNLNIWSEIASYAYPIKQIHVSDRGHFGFTRLHAQKYQLSEFGFVVPMQSLLHTLRNTIKKQTNITNLFGQKLHALQKNSFGQQLSLISTTDESKQTQLTAKLIVAADGSESFVRQLLNVSVERHDYQQTAIVTNVGVDRVTKNVAYERFTASGPLALLPISDRAFSVVWSLQKEQAQQFMDASEATFLQALQSTFGYRVGKMIWAGERQSFPLTRIQSQHLVANKTVILGNAAHTLHPIAGQGFNLTQRDIAVLLEIITDALDKNEDFASESNLQKFVNLRQNDVKTLLNSTDFLVKLFSNNFFPHNILRNLALVGLDCSPFKKSFAKRAMGFQPTMPTLAIESD